jgi:hypothetical protein
MLKKLFQSLWQDKVKLLLLLLGTAAWSATMVKSGLVYSYGVGFWGPNGHDGIWHIALSQSLAQGSWQMPVFAGEPIQNYHIGFDLILAALHKITFIPISNLYFQILPPIFAFFIGYLVYDFVYSWRKSAKQAFWATFFVYFGGSFGWLVTLLRNGEIGGESLFWAQQSVSTLINPPFALSLIFLFVGLILLVKGVEQKNKNLFIITTFLFGILIQIKVYAGLLVLGGLLVAGLWQLLIKRSASIIKVFVGTLVLAILLFTKVSKGVSSEVIFRPFWFLEQMTSSTDRFYWPRLAGAMINYKLAGNIIKGSLAYLFAFLIFFIGNFGTRVVGFLWYWRKRKDIGNFKYVDFFIAFIVLFGILVPVFFIQSGTAWNTIQFMYYSMVFMGITSGIWLGELLERSSKKFFVNVITAFIVVLTIPTTIATLIYNYLPSRPPAKISNNELRALKFLKGQPMGVILTEPFDKKLAAEAVNNPPRPLYLYESTAYVSAYTGKPTFLEDEVNLEIMGYDWRVRRQKAERFFKDPSYNGKYELLDGENITYVYVIKNLQDTYKNLYLNSERIFENDEVIIYENK